MSSTKWLEEGDSDTLLLEVEDRKLVVYNDDVNTFDDVIQWLVEICDHDVLQAEQCSIIIHYKGKCTVKSGSYDDLEPRASALLHRGLSAEIH